MLAQTFISSSPSFSWSLSSSDVPQSGPADACACSALKWNLEPRMKLWTVSRVWEIWKLLCSNCSMDLSFPDCSRSSVRTVLYCSESEQSELRTDWWYHNIHIYETYPYHNQIKLYYQLWSSPQLWDSFEKSDLQSFLEGSKLIYLCNEGIVR